MKLFRYSLAMIVFPLFCFYFSFYYFFEGDQDYLGWSGVIAVIAVNIVIVAYVWMAWNEDNEQTHTDPHGKKTD